MYTPNTKGINADPVHKTAQSKAKPSQAKLNRLEKKGNGNSH
jgi:hypothetical protein